MEFIEKVQSNRFFRNTIQYHYPIHTFSRFEQAFKAELEKIKAKQSQISEEIQKMEQENSSAELANDDRYQALLRQKYNIDSSFNYLNERDNAEEGDYEYDYKAMIGLIIIDKLASKNVFTAMSTTEFTTLIQQLKASKFSYVIPSLFESIGYDNLAKTLIQANDFQLLNELDSEQFLNVLTTLSADDLFDLSQVSKQHIQKALFSPESKGTELSTLMVGIRQKNPRYNTIIQNIQRLNNENLAINRRIGEFHMQRIAGKQDTEAVSIEDLNKERSKLQGQLEAQTIELKALARKLLHDTLINLSTLDVFKDISFEKLDHQLHNLAKRSSNAYFKLPPEIHLNSIPSTTLSKMIQTPQDLILMSQRYGKERGKMSEILENISDNTFECTYQDMTDISVEFDMIFRDDPALQALLYSKVINPKGCQQFDVTVARETIYSQRFDAFMQYLEQLNNAIKPKPGAPKDAHEKYENIKKPLINFVCQLFADTNNPDELKTTLIELLQLANRSRHNPSFFKSSNTKTYNELIKALSETLFEYEQLSTDGIPSPLANLSKALGFQNETNASEKTLKQALNQLIKDAPSLPAERNEKAIELQTFKP